MSIVKGAEQLKPGQIWRTQYGARVRLESFFNGRWEVVTLSGRVSRTTRVKPRSILGHWKREEADATNATEAGTDLPATTH